MKFLKIITLLSALALLALPAVASAQGGAAGDQYEEQPPSAGNNPNGGSGNDNPGSKNSGNDDDGSSQNGSSGGGGGSGGGSGGSPTSGSAGGGGYDYGGAGFGGAGSAGNYGGKGGGDLGSSGKGGGPGSASDLTGPSDSYNPDLSGSSADPAAGSEDLSAAADQSSRRFGNQPRPVAAVGGDRDRGGWLLLVRQRARRRRACREPRELPIPLVLLGSSAARFRARLPWTPRKR